MGAMARAAEIVHPGKISARSWAITLGVLGIALVVAIAVALVIRHGHVPVTPSARVTVDFAARRQTNGSMLGFLHGMDEKSPETRWIAPLHPALWRGSLYSAPYQRAVSFGAKYILVVSDLWGYPGAGWYGRKPPWEEPLAWFAFVRDLALANRTRALVWGIWNEPNGRYFWNGTKAQYYETFRIADAAIRSVLGSGALVSGPGVSGFSWPWLEGLLNYCRARKCRVDVLAWHELQAAGISKISEHLKDARKRLLASSHLSVTHVRFIYISEYLAESDALYPGELIAYLDQLERGGANGGAMACWADPGGSSACDQHTLDGLLNPGTKQPRGVWWAAKAYADGVGSRVETSSTTPALAALASYRAPDARHAQVLLGYFDTHTRLPGTLTVKITLRDLNALQFLRTARKVRVSMERLLAGASPLTPRTIGRPQDIAISHGAVTITAPRIALHDAVAVRLSVAGR
jgi:hypothetical protein